MDTLKCPQRRIPIANDRAVCESLKDELSLFHLRRHFTPLFKYSFSVGSVAPRDVYWVQGMVGRLTISKSHGVSLSKLKDPQAQIELAKPAAEKKWPLDKLEAQIRMRKGKAGKAASPGPACPTYSRKVDPEVRQKQHACGISLRQASDQWLSSEALTSP